MQQTLIRRMVAVIVLGMAIASSAEAQREGRGEGRGQRGFGGRGDRMMNREDGAPKVGEVAPLFTLRSLDGKSKMELKSFAGKRPVVLIFGSYT